MRILLVRAPTSKASDTGHYGPRASRAVFIAREVDRPLGPLPERVAVSVVTIGELELGVLAAVDGDVLARRADTLALALQSDPVPVSEAVMSAWARLVIDCRRAGVHRTVRLTDALIAATAIVPGLPVITQDEAFDQIATATTCSASRGCDPCGRRLDRATWTTA